MAELRLRPDQSAWNEFLPKNLLVNPGFEIWQRGYAFTTSGGYVADEWLCTPASGPVSVNRYTAAVKDGVSSLVASWATGATWFGQGVESWKMQEGKELTFSVWVHTTVPGTVRAAISDYDGATVDYAWSVYHPGTGWAQLTATKIVRTGLVTNAGYPHGYPLMVMVYSDTGQTGLVIDSASLVRGSYPEGIAYVQLDFMEEISRCHRFYQRYDSWAWTSRDDGSGTGYCCTMPQMAASPTVTYRLLQTYTSGPPFNFARLLINGGTMIPAPSGPATYCTNMSMQWEMSLQAPFGVCSLNADFDLMVP